MQRAASHTNDPLRDPHEQNLPPRQTETWVCPGKPQVSGHVRGRGKWGQNAAHLAGELSLSRPRAHLLYESGAREPYDTVLPFSLVEDTEKYLQAQEGDAADLAKSSRTKEGDLGLQESGPVSREEFEKVREELQRATMRTGALRDELMAVQAKHLASLGEEDKELELAVAAKDDELKHALAAKDQEIMELRRRLPRVGGEEG